MTEKNWGLPGERMSEAEMHDFGIQVVVRDLKKSGHEIVSVATEIKDNPQIVAKLKDHLAFIAVRTAPYPYRAQPPKKALVEAIVAHAAKHRGKAYFAPVEISNSKGVDAGDERLSAKPIRGAGFYVNYRGLVPLEDVARNPQMDNQRIADPIPEDVNQDAFLKALGNLAADLGLLDDLPAELANTVANVYYKFWESYLALAPMKEGKPFFPMPAVGESPLQSYARFSKRSSEATAGYEFAAKMVRSIRETRTKNPDRPEISDYMVQVMLDSMKFNIENADEKTPIRRSIERKFKTVDEREDLYHRMRPFMALLSKSGPT